MKMHKRCLSLLFLSLLFTTCFTSCRPSTSQDETLLIEQFEKTLSSIEEQRNELLKTSKEWDKEERRLQKNVAQALEALSPKERERVESGIRTGTFSIDNERDPAVLSAVSHLEELLLIQNNSSRLKEQISQYDYQIERARSEKYKLEKRLEAKKLLSGNNTEGNLTELASLSDEAIDEEVKRVVQDPTAKVPTADDRSNVLDDIFAKKEKARKQLLEKTWKTGFILGMGTFFLIYIVGSVADATSWDFDWLNWLFGILLAICVISFVGAIASCCVLEGGNVEMKEMSDSVDNASTKADSSKTTTSAKGDSKKADVPIPASSSGSKSSAQTEKSAKPSEKTEAKKIVVRQASGGGGSNSGSAPMASTKGDSSKTTTSAKGDSKKAEVPIPASASDAKSSAQTEKSAKPCEKTETKKIVVRKASEGGGNELDNASGTAAQAPILEKF